MAASVNRPNRRAFARAGAAASQVLAARIRPARDAKVIDVSAGGAYVEVSFRLLPGALVELQIDRPGRRTDLKGRVVRCAIKRLRANVVTYGAAIAFDREWADLLPERTCV